MRIIREIKFILQRIKLLFSRDIMSSSLLIASILLIQELDRHKFEKPYFHVQDNTIHFEWHGGRDICCVLLEQDLISEDIKISVIHNGNIITRSYYNDGFYWLCQYLYGVKCVEKEK